MYKLKIRDPETNLWTIGGVGIESDQGIKLKLNPGIVLSYLDNFEMILVAPNPERQDRRPRDDG